MGQNDGTRPQVAVVLGPWSSGTSAVAGVVTALGAHAHPPHAQLTDPRTPRSFESLALRRILVDCFDHDRLERTGAPSVARLREWAGPGLSVAKMPMLTFFLPEVLEAWEARFLIVRRSLEAIEATRLRRGWPVVYGRAGAVRIEAEINRGLPERALRLEVEYDGLCLAPEAAGARIAAFLELPARPEAVRRAVRPRPGAGERP